MKISFVVPVYNVERYLAVCINSILAQTFTDWELILVDDGSGDRSGAICDRYASSHNQIKVIHQENQGVSVARNTGIKAACGEWICFLDSDDAVVPSFASDFLPYLTEQNDVCLFNYYELRDKDFQVRDLQIVSIPFHSLNRDDFKEFSYAVFNRDYKGKYDYHRLKLSTPGKWYRKRLLMEHNISFSEGLVTGEDAVFNLQVYLSAQKGVWLDYAPYFHRVWRGAVSQKYNPHAFEDFSRLHEELENCIRRNNISIESYRPVLCERYIWSAGFCCLLDYCHPSNPKGYSARERDFQAMMQGKLGAWAGKADLRNFRIEKKMLFYLIQHKCFFGISMLCTLKRLFGGI